MPINFVLNVSVFFILERWRVGGYGVWTFIKCYNDKAWKIGCKYWVVQVSKIVLIVLLHENDFRSDHRSDNLWAKTVQRKSGRLSALFSARLHRRQHVFTDAQGLTCVDISTFFRISLASVYRICCHARWNISESLCAKKWQTHAEHWNVHASNWVQEMARACRMPIWTRVYITQPPVDIILARS